MPNAFTLILLSYNTVLNEHLLLLLIYLLALGRAYIFRVFLRDDIKHFYTFLQYDIKIGDIGHFYEGIGKEK